MNLYHFNYKTWFLFDCESDFQRGMQVVGGTVCVCTKDAELNCELTKFQKRHFFQDGEIAS